MIKPRLGGVYEYIDKINKTRSRWEITNLGEEYCDLVNVDSGYHSDRYELAHFTGDYWESPKEDNFTKLYLTLKNR